MNKQSTLTIEKPVALGGMVKWFDSSKGFGFVVVDGIDKDFLLHGHVLQAFGRTSIVEGSAISFHYEHSASGLKITELLSIKAPEAIEDEYTVTEPEHVSEQKVPARVKWFDGKKGYGFVNEYGSDEDIFVGQAVLKSCAMQDLKMGEAICIQIAQTNGRKSVHCIHDWLKP